MKVKDLKLINFRNYERLDIGFNKNINVFIGKNAQGKTNLIEALYMCSQGSSFRTNRDRELINLDKNVAYIASNIKKGNYNRFIELKFEENNPKIIRINKNPIKSQKELSEVLDVVVFSPDDLRIIKDGPNKRRTFIDNLISQIKPVYNYNLTKYNKLLYQRNNVLKSNKFENDIGPLIEIFDLQIIKVATNIIMERKLYIEKLNSISNRIHREISNGGEDLAIYYDSNVLNGEYSMDKKSIEARYYDLLKKSLAKDLRYGTSQIGPHRDDFLTRLNNKDTRIFGSQGQQRSFILSLKLGEVELIKRERGNYPVLLLDDVFSELDRERRRYLISLFSNVQTFITSSNSERLDSMKNLDKSIFYIEDGEVKEK